MPIHVTAHEGLYYAWESHGNTALPMVQDSRNTGVHLVREPVDYEWPSMKRQKLDDGTVFTTVTAEKKVRFNRWNRKTNLPKRPLFDSVSFKEENYRGVLLTYMLRIGKVEELTFQFVRDKENKIRNNSLYISTVEACNLIGRGRGPTKKKSKHMACLDILQKLGVVPEEIMRDTMAIQGLEPVLLPVKSIVENPHYLKGNFRGALNDYLLKHLPDVNLLFDSKVVLVEKQPVYVTTCRADRGEFKGCGHATKKKKSIHLACLDFMLNMELLTKEQHLEKHPSATAAIEVGMDKKGISKVENI